MLKCLFIRKVPEYMKANHDTNSGDDIAGTVEQIGNDVYDFSPGDRVAAFHTMREPHGSFAEYALAEAHTTFHLPKKTSFEGACGQ
jgi:NADPH:quinone reductase